MLRKSFHFLASLLCILLLCFIIIKHDLYPENMYFRFKLSQAISDKTESVYLKDLLLSHFERAYILHGYGESRYDLHNCLLENEAPPSENTKVISFVKKDCSKIDIRIPDSFIHEARMIGYKKKGNNSYDDSKLYLFYDGEPCRPDASPCFRLD